MTDDERVAQLSARRNTKNSPARGAKRVVTGFSIALTLGFVGAMATQANSATPPPVIEQVVVVQAQQPGEPVVLQVKRPEPPTAQAQQTKPSTKTRGS
jgi:cell division septal protein FtsQ